MGNRSGRVAGGCLIVAVGAPVGLVAYLFTGLAGSYGTDHWWQEAILWAVLAAAFAAVVWGVALIFGRPKG